MKLAEQTIRAIWSRIPPVNCIPGCTDCCGPLPWSRWEWERVWPRLETYGIKCPYAAPGYGCGIYESRPVLCRLYAATERPDLACPHRCKSEIPLTVDETETIMTTYLAVLDL